MLNKELKMGKLGTISFQKAKPAKVIFDPERERALFAEVPTKKLLTCTLEFTPVLGFLRGGQNGMLMKTYNKGKIKFGFVVS